MVALPRPGTTVSLTSHGLTLSSSTRLSWSGPVKTWCPESKKLTEVWSQPVQLQDQRVSCLLEWEIYLSAIFFPGKVPGAGT